MKPQSKAYFFALLAVGLWSTVATAFKLALANLSFVELLSISTFVATLVSLIILISEGKFKQLYHLSRNQWLNSMASGVLNPWLYYLILFKAYDLLPAQEAMVLNYTWPIMLVLLAAPLLKQRLKASSLITILLSFLGVVVIALKGNFTAFHFSNPLGTLLALGSSIVWALFWIANLRSTVDNSLKLLISFGTGFVLSLPVLLISETTFNFSLMSISAAIYVGIAEMGLTFYLWLKALQLSQRTDQIGQLIFLSPLLSLGFIWIFLHEPIHPSTLIGLVMILLATYINQRISKKQDPS